MILRLRETADEDRPDRPCRVTAEPDGESAAVACILREGEALVFGFSALNFKARMGLG